MMDALGDHRQVHGRNTSRRRRRGHVCNEWEKVTSWTGVYTPKHHWMFVFIACLNAMNWRQGARQTDRRPNDTDCTWDWEGNPICQSINFGRLLIAAIYVEENWEIVGFSRSILHILANLAFHPRGPLDSIKLLHMFVWWWWEWYN